MALIHPLLCFYANCAITRCKSALQSNVVRSCVGGEEVAVAAALETDCWRCFVGPQNPNPKTQIRSLASASQNLSDLDHVRGELCTLDSCWGGFILPLSSHDAHLAQCHHDAIFACRRKISPVSSWILSERGGNDNKSRQPEAIGTSKTNFPRENDFS